MGAVLLMVVAAVALGLMARMGYKKRDREWSARRPDAQVTDLPPDRTFSVTVPADPAPAARSGTAAASKQTSTGSRTASGGRKPAPRSPAS